VSRVDPDSTGLHPAWRNALAYTLSAIVWADGTPSSEIDALRANFKKIMAQWESIAPDSCAYINEVCMAFQAVSLQLSYTEYSLHVKY
jgi:hypothetical protein